MKKVNNLLMGLLLATTLGFYGCGGGGGSVTTDSLTLENSISSAEDLQEILPAIDASLSTIQVSDAGVGNVSGMVKTIGVYNVPDLPATPADLFASAVGGVARYPSSGYIEDFYGENGNLAYMELREPGDSWGDYQVTLYVYPSTSPSVYYTVEQYRVPSDNWDILLNQENIEDPIAFEDLKTYYFDGRIETRTAEWSRYVDDNVYVSSFFTIPTDFADAAYTYSATPTDPTKEAAVDVGDESEFSIKQTISIPAGDGCTPVAPGACPTFPSDGYCSITSGTEFYAEHVDGSGNVTKYSKTFYEETINTDSSPVVTADTVRIYQIDPNGDKTVRSKTVTTIEHSSGTWTTTATEDISQHYNADDGKIHYDSTVSMTPAADYTIRSGISSTPMTIVLAMAETVAGNNIFVGTMTTTKTDSTTLVSTVKTYNVSLSADDGLNIVPSEAEAGSAVTLTYPVGSVNHTGEVAGERVISADLNGFTFTGVMKGGVLEGTLTDPAGAVAHVMIVGSFSLVNVSTVNGLVANYKFDENSGSLACDFVGNHTGTINGTVAWSTGAKGTGTALTFNGASDITGTYVSIPDAADLDLTSMTILMWVNSSLLTGNSVLLSKGAFSPTNNVNYAFWMAKKVGTFGYYNGSTYKRDKVSKANFINNTNRWYMLGVTVGASGINYYKNGVLDKGNSGAVTLIPNNHELWIGRQDDVSNYYSFKGSMDEIMIFNRELAATEITQMYDLTKP